MGAALEAIIFPTEKDPVKVTFLIFSWVIKGSPHSSPYPEITFKTPGGNSCWRISQINKAQKGACSAVFNTTVLPATIAGAIFATVKNNGAFHGTMAQTTPMGSLVV